MEINNFHTYKEKHTGDQTFRIKGCENKQENNRGKLKEGVFQLPVPTIIIKSMVDGNSYVNYSDYLNRRCIRHPLSP